MYWGRGRAAEDQQVAVLAGPAIRLKLKIFLLNVDKSVIRSLLEQWDEIFYNTK